MGKFCSCCGKELKEHDIFCSNCGTKIELVVNDNNFNNINANVEKITIDSFAIASLICGIVGIIIMGFILGTIAIVTAFLSTTKHNGKLIPHATAGLVLGIIDIISLIFVSYCFNIKLF